MAVELEKPKVVISETALTQIDRVVSSQPPDNKLYLRVYIQSNSGGLSFGMALDKKKNSDDHTEIHPSGIEVLIDSISFPYLKDARVSYTEGDKSGFTITSPNAETLASGGCSGCSGDAGCCG